MFLRQLVQSLDYEDSPPILTIPLEHVLELQRSPGKRIYLYLRAKQAQVQNG